MKIFRKIVIIRGKQIIQMIRLSLLLSMLLAVSCSYKTDKNTISKVINSNNTIHQEEVTKLDGEWAVRDEWQDSILTFTPHDKNFKQEIFPSYNTIVFNKKDHRIQMNTYGEFGDGMSAIQNLKIENSKWSVENGILKLKFTYSDYTGQHQLDNVYQIEKKPQQLILKKLK